jgi:hypothetical protein
MLAELYKQITENLPVSEATPRVQLSITYEFELLEHNQFPVQDI